MPAPSDIFPPGKKRVFLAITSSAFHGRGVQPGGCGTRSAQERGKRAQRLGIFMRSAVASPHGDLVVMGVNPVTFAVVLFGPGGVARSLQIHWRDMLVARALPGPKTPRRKRHRNYAHDHLGLLLQFRLKRANSRRCSYRPPPSGPGPEAPEAQPKNFFATMVALWPPKPKELLMTALSGILRAVLGT